MINQQEYLTESSLKLFLYDMFGHYEWIHNKSVPNSNIKNRPDFRSEKFKLIIEFDGDRHYTQSNVIIADELKDFTYTKMGYKIFRIPYFIQLCDKLIFDIFSYSPKKIIQTYPHGFISDTCTHPADFCALGIKRFNSDLQRFSYCSKEILDSLEEKAKTMDRRLIFF
jgi:hypothetical protein